MKKSLQEIITTVQHNCHIADARYAGDYTLCVYLLKMREMYRWEQGIDFKTLLTTDDVGDWLTEREGVWDEIEEQEYKTLPIYNQSGIKGDVKNNDKNNVKNYDPFDNELINTLLENEKLVYNAGLGIRCRPHFFIAELNEIIIHEDYTVYISGKEYARDMAAPAAMAQENKIFIRQESLRRVIWEILDDARVTGLDNPLTRAMSFYNYDDDAEVALNKMTEVEIEYVMQHEIGEVKAGNILDKNWNDMLNALVRTQAEIMLRAVRDHLADSLTTLPTLLKNNNAASIHFYFGNMTAMRKHLAPSIIEAYEHWHSTGSLDLLVQFSKTSQAHWQTLAEDITALYSESAAAEPIEALIKSRKR